MLIESLTPQQKKALIRILVKEPRVMSREEILPMYEMPTLWGLDRSGAPPHFLSKGYEARGFYRFAAIHSQVSYGTRMCPVGK